MQTFLPYADFKLSAECLDNKRLGKQLIEVTQIYKALTNPLYGWQNHPAVKMWKGHELSLLEYGNECYKEWKKRRNKIHKSGEEIANNYTNLLLKETISYPWWIGDENFHSSHRSNLLRKDSAHYGQFGWHEDGALPYIWPI